MNKQTLNVHWLYTRVEVSSLSCTPSICGSKATYICAPHSSTDENKNKHTLESNQSSSCPMAYQCGWSWKSNLHLPIMSEGNFVTLKGFIVFFVFLTRITWKLTLRLKCMYMNNIYPTHLYMCQRLLIEAFVVKVRLLFGFFLDFGFLTLTYPNFSIYTIFFKLEILP